MTDCIIKLTRGKIDYFMEWSTEHAAPTTNGMLLDEFTQWYQQTHGTRSIPAFRKLIKRAQKTGSSWEGQSLEHILSVNRAGDGFPGNISKTQIIRKYCPSIPTLITTRIDTIVIPDGHQNYKFRAPVGTFDKGLETLARDNYEIVSADSLIRLRMLCVAAKDGTLESDHRLEKVNNGTWVGDGIIYLPDGDKLIVAPRHNPILRETTAATQQHMNGNEYFIDSRTVKALLNASSIDYIKSIQGGVLRIPAKTFKRHIPLDELSTSPLTSFLFGERANNYGMYLLRPAGVSSVPIDFCSIAYAKSQKKPFVRALWFDGPSTGGTISGNGHPLSDYYGRVSGTRIKS